MKGIKHKSVSKVYEMSPGELAHQLKRVMADIRGVNCYRCAYEHDCGIYGCAIMRRAAEFIKDVADGRGQKPARIVSVGGETEWQVRNIGYYMVYRCAECGCELQVKGNAARLKHCPECGRLAARRVTVGGGAGDE